MQKTVSRRAYIAIDLKSFYASVECIERGLDPLTTNLVVADASRTEKTICHILQIKRRRSCRYHPEKVDIYLHKFSVGTRHEVVNKTVGKNRNLRFGGIFKRNQAHDLRSPFFLIY